MEVAGALASIIGIVGAGAKLSIALFDFANLIGSAGSEVRAIGTEICLFCSVLKQLEKTLAKAKHRRYSSSALETTQQILDQCKKILDDIKDIIDGLQPRKPSTATTVDVAARLKWTFLKRSKLQMHRATLESCKITLHLMVTTLEFAHTVASRRESTFQTDLEDEQEELMAQSLVLAQRCAIEKLERLEDDDEPDKLTFDADDAALPVDDQLTLTDYRTADAAEPSRSAPPRHEELCQDLAARASRKKRGSAWLQDLLSGGPSDSEAQRMSASSRNSNIHQLPDLLFKWTDQGSHWNELQSQSHSAGTEELSAAPMPDSTVTLINRQESVPTSPSSTLQVRSPGYLDPMAPTLSSKPLPLAPTQSKLSRRNIPTPLPLSPNKLHRSNVPPSPSPMTATFAAESMSPSIHQIATLSRPNLPATGSPSSPRVHDTPKQYKGSLSKSDTYESLVKGAIKHLGITGDPRDFTLFLVWGSGSEDQLAVSSEQKPLLLFKQMQKDGRKPIFKLKPVERHNVPDDLERWI